MRQYDDDDEVEADAEDVHDRGANLLGDELAAQGADGREVHAAADLEHAEASQHRRHALSTPRPQTSPILHNGHIHTPARRV